jgi:hypothetical protein
VVDLWIPGAEPATAWITAQWTNFRNQSGPSASPLPVSIPAALGVQAARMKAAA